MGCGIIMIFTVLVKEEWSGVVLVVAGSSRKTEFQLDNDDDKTHIISTGGKLKLAVHRSL